MVLHVPNVVFCSCSMKTRAVAWRATHRRVRSSSSVPTLPVVINRTTLSVHQKSSVSCRSVSRTLCGGEGYRRWVVLSTSSHRRNHVCANAPLPRGSVTMGHPYCLRQCQHQHIRLHLPDQEMVYLVAVLFQGIFEPIKCMGCSCFLDA